MIFDLFAEDDEARLLGRREVVSWKSRVTEMRTLVGLKEACCRVSDLD